jgi:hypothetical protein
MNEGDKERLAQQAAMDQAGALLADTIPQVLHAYYAKCVEQGFTPEQAMTLVLAIQDKFTGKIGG